MNTYDAFYNALLKWQREYPQVETEISIGDLRIRVTMGLQNKTSSVVISLQWLINNKNENFYLIFETLYIDLNNKILEKY
jgi:hypothetical protein